MYQYSKHAMLMKSSIYWCHETTQQVKELAAKLDD